MTIWNEEVKEEDFLALRYAFNIERLGQWLLDLFYATMWERLVFSLINPYPANVENMVSS